MKTFFTLMLVLTVSFAFAQRWSRLTITTMTNSPVSVLVDNRPYQANGSDRSIELNQVTPGYHSIRIYRQRGNGWRRNNQVLYESSINIRRGYDVDVLVNRFGK